MIESMLLSSECDALIYKKSGKYFGVNEREESPDIFKMITGLDASDGAVVITKNCCAIFVDGRYTNAAKISVDQTKFEILSLDISCITNWIKKKILKNSIIAYDPKFFTHSTINKIKDTLSQFRFKFTDLENLLNITSGKRELNIHHMTDAFSENRLKNAFDVIDRNNLDAYLLCDPCTISWALNIRDFDSKYTPVVFGFLVVTKNRLLKLYVDNLYSKISGKISDLSKNFCDISGEPLDIKFEHDLIDDLNSFEKIGIDESETPSFLQHKNFINIKNPCKLQKSIKNHTEIKNIKAAAKKDSVAIINFLCWLHSNYFKKSCVSELQVVERILYFRKLQDGFIGESFPCIAAADENAAIAHYSPNLENNKNIENILLLDSGGQYKYGTTDITRTICLNEVSNEQKLFYTLVLKGHIAVANAKIPIGSAGSQLDAFARQYLWNYSCDYNHSTGHGIGYMLNVHEGPISISKTNSAPLYPGMILSNEPAYYKENSFGIRLENMLLSKKEDESDFLSFETISLVPFDFKFIDRKLLSGDEINWINTYHNCIIDELSGCLDSEVFNWLKSQISV